MHTRHRTIFHPALGLVLVALLAGCGSENNGQTVAVNLSLIVNSRQAQQGPASRVFAWLERWFPGATPAWAQSASEIARIEVQVSGPGIAVPVTASVPVSNPTSGQEIPVSMQVPVGPNRTFTVAAYNVANEKIFGGTLPNVNLTAGAPINLPPIELKRLFTVTVQKHPEGTGDGTVTSTPVGIDCGGTCSGQFEEGTTVSLNAAAAPGSVFAGWSGGCSGTGPCSVTTTATVTARFNVAVATDRLTVILAGTGPGSVTSNPSGIACPGICAGDFATGTNVTLTAAPTNGSTFDGFSGAGCSGPGSSCTVAMVGSPTVTATFTAAPPSFTLTVTKSGAGLGIVDSDPPGITACSTTCSATFVTGTIVNLTATPQGGSTFVGWGGACSGAGACSVDMSANRAVTATFDPPVSLSTLTLQKQGTGSGNVTSIPSGINCGGTCPVQSAPFGTGSSVTLTATPDFGSVFTGWAGCSGGSTCTTLMSGDQTIVAIFDAAPPDLVTLTVTKQGSGDGTVTSQPAGIVCGAACQFSYQRGTVVTLTAAPDANSSFNDWHGGGACDNSSSPTCQLVMSDNQTVSAHFDD